MQTIFILSGDKLVLDLDTVQAELVKIKFKLSISHTDVHLCIIAKIPFPHSSMSETSLFLRSKYSWYGF